MINFAVIGIHHGHIFGQTDALLAAGATLVSYYSTPSPLTAEFARKYPQSKAVRSEAEILYDQSIHMVVSADIPCERAALGVRVMQHGKDYMSDKPGFTTLAQLGEVRRVQATTQRIYSICYSERLENKASVKAGELIAAGEIGRVIQTIGLGPHRPNLPSRPTWFFEREKYGGILCDIASHQFDQFLYFTGSTQAEIIAAQVGNLNHPQYSELQDFGDAMVRGNGGIGYLRVDWFTPDGLPVWGDGRLTIMGTDGYMELRKYIDLEGRPGGSHLFVVNKQGVRYVDCSTVELPYGRNLVADVLNRTETAMSQTHCFLASELALTAQIWAEQHPMGKDK